MHNLLPRQVFGGAAGADGRGQDVLRANFGAAAQLEQGGEELPQLPDREKQSE